MPTLLTASRLPTIGRLWSQLAERSDREGWPAARYLATLLEHELAERYQRRIQRHLQEAELSAGKNVATFDFAAVPMINMSRITALAARGSWLNKGANILAFGPPGVGKSYLAAALGQALVENGYRVLFTRITDLVHRLQAARRDFTLEGAVDKLDKYALRAHDN